MQGADTRIATPGEHHLLDGAGADQLVVDQVRRHAHQRQLLAVLADGLVTSGVGDQVREALERGRIAVANHLLDGFRELQEPGHAVRFQTGVVG